MRMRSSERRSRRSVFSSNLLPRAFTNTLAPTVRRGVEQLAPNAWLPLPLEKYSVVVPPFFPLPLSRVHPPPQIGRASCRERVS